MVLRHAGQVVCDVRLIGALRNCRAVHSVWNSRPNRTKIPIYDPATGELAFEAGVFVAVLGDQQLPRRRGPRSQELLHWCHHHVKPPPVGRRKVAG